ncbi:hypothetical protein QLX67_09705 [Balneolaceae bacterium ANBcel3]|nr:hypothetical protein [Balneolaceae bacterium ANBcel3]
MKKVFFILFAIMLVGTAERSVMARGNNSAVMNVSVTVVEPSQIQVSEMLAAELNGEREKTFSEGLGVISIPSLPNSEMIVRVSGERNIGSKKGGTVTFDPDIRVGRNVGKEFSMSADNEQRLVRVTESDNGGYRAVVEMELFGTLAAADQETGAYTGVYTITTEHL